MSRKINYTQKYRIDFNAVLLTKRRESIIDQIKSHIAADGITGAELVLVRRFGE